MTKQNLAEFLVERLRRRARTARKGRRLGSIPDRSDNVRITAVGENTIIPKTRNHAEHPSWYSLVSNGAPSSQLIFSSKGNGCDRLEVWEGGRITYSLAVTRFPITFHAHLLLKLNLYTYYEG